MMSFVIFLASTQAAVSPSSSLPSKAYAGAVACASKFARGATFERRNIFAIAEEAAKQCSDEIGASAQLLSQAQDQRGADKPAIAREYVGAKARVAAWSVLVDRLEAGEKVQVPAGMDAALGETQTRYIECSRSAGGIKASSVFFGESWLAETLKKDANGRRQAFINVGRQVCSRSYQRLLSATRDAGDGAGRAKQQALQIELAGAEQFAADTWLRRPKRR